MSSSANFSSCPPTNELLDFANLSIPYNISTGFIPARNSFYDSMVSCCSSNPVKVTKDCYYWCQLPSTIIDGAGWGSCISRNQAVNATERVTISGIHLAGTGNLVTGTGRVVGFALAASLLLHVVSM